MKFEIREVSKLTYEQVKTYPNGHPQNRLRVVSSESKKDIKVTYFLKDESIKDEEHTIKGKIEFRFESLISRAKEYSNESKSHDFIYNVEDTFEFDCYSPSSVGKFRVFLCITFEGENQPIEYQLKSLKCINKKGECKEKDHIENFSHRTTIKNEFSLYLTEGAKKKISLKLKPKKEIEKSPQKKTFKKTTKEKKKPQPKIIVNTKEVDSSDSPKNSESEKDKEDQENSSNEDEIKSLFGSDIDSIIKYHTKNIVNEARRWQVKYMNLLELSKTSNSDFKENLSNSESDSHSENDFDSTFGLSQLNVDQKNIFSATINDYQKITENWKKKYQDLKKSITNS